MVKLGPEAARIFRITHIDNIPWILKHGLHCQRSKAKDPDFVPIGMADLIAKRVDHAVKLGPGGVLGDYVPFYFTPHSVMMYNIKTGRNGVIQRENQEIVILVSSLHRLSELEAKFVFTNGHAYMVETEYREDIADLDIIDWPLLQRRDFKRSPDDPGKMNRYQAEALVHRGVPVDALLGIVCYDHASKRKLEQAASDQGLEVKVKVHSDWYF